MLFVTLLLAVVHFCIKASACQQCRIGVELIFAEEIQNSRAREFALDFLGSCLTGRDYRWEGDPKPRDAACEGKSVCKGWNIPLFGWRFHGVKNNGHRDIESKNVCINGLCALSAEWTADCGDIVNCHDHYATCAQCDCDRE